ncbi:MAG TPA: phosphatidylglycerophosphatase A [Verrucomicrobiae bacterium]|nr:phosphatidylglycerophosphatase A [Verrucomicrobiae bacterium]
MNSVVLWVAQGFGAGRIPFAPGTFGSLVGLLWFYLLLRTGNFWCYLAGTLSGVALSVWLCGKAERILNQTDPGSIVLDEISAMPLCFILSIGVPWFKRGELSTPHWAFVLIIFILFRIFDIAKPWPIRGAQKLPGGWGVTVDDALAALYVALLSLFAALFR